MGIDLTTIQGSGNAGRVLEEDLHKAPAAAAAAAPAPGAAPVAAPVRPAPRPGQEEVIEITDMVGKAMVRSMAESLSVPYMALGEELDITNLLALQKSLKEHAVKKHGTKLTVTAFIIKCISLALADNPRINTKFGKADADPPYFTMYGSHNISIAIDTPNGLMVPNIKDVGNLSVLEIQNEIMRLADGAKANKLSFDDIKGGTISFSNVGVIGTKDPRPILFDGQCCIGAMGRLMTLPRYDDKMQLVPRSIVNVRWVADHRHVDGATLAHFSNSFKRYVENPGAWVLTLK
jgi:2-oxoisovalerate dehydrogenase E2 component (dihydrolipoyl transacylase)